MCISLCISPSLTLSSFSTHVCMMRNLVYLWWVFQRSRLCFTTVSTSNTWRSLPQIVTRAGTLSTCNLVLTPPVGQGARAIHWVGFI